MQTARIDPALAARVVGVRELRYTTPAAPGADRPPHVRAASGLASFCGRLVVIQDDAAFLATVAGDAVAAIALPRGPGGRRRFELALGNKQSKLDLEACVAVGDELWVFGSGSAPPRERIVHVARVPRVVDASEIYARARAALGSAINLEGAACVGDELWWFHRGNTGAGDHGPAVVRFAREAVARWLAGSNTIPEVAGVSRFDLGAIDGVGLGFTDAVSRDQQVFYLAAAEASPDAIADGRVLGSQLGVIDGAGVRAAPLSHRGLPVKAEGIAFDPDRPRHAWIAIDPDEIDRPAELLEVELIGPW